MASLSSMENILLTNYEEEMDYCRDGYLHAAPISRRNSRRSSRYSRYSIFFAQIIYSCKSDKCNTNCNLIISLTATYPSFIHLQLLQFLATLG